MENYTLRITATYFSAFSAETRVNELPITEETALSLKKDYQEKCPCPISGSGCKKMSISVEILKGDECIGGWRNI